MKRKKYLTFKDNETWCLASTVSTFILPRLKRFKEITKLHPVSVTREEWEEILNKMILTFELIVRDDGLHDWTKVEEKSVEEGLDLFRKWFFALWW
jgi:hypothetical protein